MLLRPQHALWLQPQSLDGQDLLFTQTKPGSIDPVSVTEETGIGRGFHGLIPGEDLLRNRRVLIERRNRGKEIVGAEVLAFQHPAAAHDVAIFSRSGSVQAAADLC